MAQNKSTSSTKKKTASGRKTSASKGSTSRSKASSSRSTTKRKTKAEQLKAAKLRSEVISITLLVLAFFVILCIYFNFGGLFGQWIRKSLFGVFGWPAYLLPLLIFVGAIFKVFNPTNQRLNNKILQSTLAIVFLSSVSHVRHIDQSQITQSIFDESAFYPSLINYYSLSSKHHYGGGFVGGLVGDAFAFILGPRGGVIILSLIILALLILITEQSFVEILKWVWKKLKIFAAFVAAKFKEFIENQRAQAQLVREENAKRLAKEESTSKSSNKQAVKSSKSDRTAKRTTRKNDPFTHIIDSELREEASTQEETFIQEDVFDEPRVEPVVENKIDKSEKKTTLSDEQISFFENQKNQQKENKLDAETFNEIVEDMKIYETPENNKTMYEFPPIELLKDNPFSGSHGSRDSIRKSSQVLQETFDSFGVGAKVINVTCGPTVTRYEVQPDPGVKVNKITNLADDIALKMAAKGIRIEAPIPGKSYIGIEIPNKQTTSVFLREVIENDYFMKFPSKVAFALGKDIAGEIIVADIARMPHMLIAGATGSGKSVCINSLITSILFRAHPDDVKFILIDPKVVELKIYNNIPHLLIPVVTDPKKAAGALFWAVQEMDARYQLFSAANARDLKGYNKIVEENPVDADGTHYKKLPQIIVVVDELADLMEVASKEVETYIKRLTQLARAAGIHLIIATQRPSVDVITGVIKSNIPSRIAFAVSSNTDSRVIMDQNGAEQLVGRGDMLYKAIDMQKPTRVQGAFISDREVEAVTDFLRASGKVDYDENLIDQLEKSIAPEEEQSLGGSTDLDVVDDYFEQALEYIMEKQKASASMIQRRFRVGYNRAARIVDQLEDAGFIGPEQGSKPREVLLTPEAYYNYKQQDSEKSLQADNETDYEEA